jgi:exodeoxyribonuclease V alpha subunit
MDAGDGSVGTRAGMSAPEELEGRIQSVVYQSDDGSFCIMHLVRDDNPEPITVKGFLAGASPGERVRLTGQWEKHPKFGRQFKVEQCMPLLPASAEGITAYLGSGLVSGVGPRMARRIVDRFGEDTLRVIGEEPARLAEVEGFGKKRIAAIQEAWQGQRGVRDSMLFLQ